MLPKIPLVKQAIESLYDGKAVIEEARKRKNEKNVTVSEWAVVAEDIPCRVSYKTISAAEKSDTADTIAQAITLFTSPDIIVLPGSRITVRQRGREMKLSCSGIPAVYDSHQEIPLARREEHP
ncbi:MAG: hypothetical protein ACFNWY_01395 [Negativicutes bacterium]